MALDLPDPSVTKVEKERERPPPPSTPTPPPFQPPTAATIAKLDEAVVLADADVVAARRRVERAETYQQKCLAEWTEAASIGHDFDDENHAALLVVRAELAQEWEKHHALVVELRREQADAEYRLDEARDAAREAREDVEAEKRIAARTAEFTPSPYPLFSHA